jgi:hypothetical protein
MKPTGGLLLCYSIRLNNKFSFRYLSKFADFGLGPSVPVEWNSAEEKGMSTRHHYHSPDHSEKDNDIFSWKHNICIKNDPTYCLTLKNYDGLAARLCLSACLTSGPFQHTIAHEIIIGIKK